LSACLFVFSNFWGYPGKGRFCVAACILIPSLPALPPRTQFLLD